MVNEHVIEAIGKSRVVVRDGKVVEVGPPLIRDCPLARRFAVPVDEISSDAVSRNIAERIASFGMCTARRELSSTEPFVGFGASELLSTALETDIIDAAIIACDGAGTVVITDPEMVQGIGGRMSGLIQTSPIPEVMSRIENKGGIVVDPGTASLDPVRGLTKAKKAGYSRIAITVASALVTEEVRKMDPEAIIIAVHTTGITKEDAIIYRDHADIVTSCASQAVRNICGPAALIQAGTTVPVFAMSEKGKEMIISRMKRISYPLLITHCDPPTSGSSSPDPLV